LRYQWFNELLREHHFDLIATAHHLNDSIETVLLNLVRGTGLDGLDGIESKKEKLIRPMLFATRQQIEDYAKGNKIDWREDKSNATDDYARNFIRHRVYPQLIELNPSLERTFRGNIDRIGGATELMLAGIEKWKTEFQTQKGNHIHLNKKGFEKSKNPEGVLWNLIKPFGFNLDQCQQIIKGLNRQPGKLFSSSEFKLVIDRVHLIISKAENELTKTLIGIDQTEAVLGNFKVSIEMQNKNDFKRDPSIAVLDFSKLNFPLQWRKWRNGDCFHPLGMEHKKKLSDFLIDQKISLIDKGTVTILESGNEIVWVVGLRIDDRYKVTEATKSTVVLRVSTSN
jgi:tRNA(Ile)-lysidine synthase